MPDALNHSALCQDVGQRVLVAFPSSPSLVGTLLERPAQGQSPSPAVPNPSLSPCHVLGGASPIYVFLILSALLVSVWPALHEGRKREGAWCGMGVHLLRSLCVLPCVLRHLKAVLLHSSPDSWECGVVSSEASHTGLMGVQGIPRGFSSSFIYLVCSFGT